MINRILIFLCFMVISNVSSAQSRKLLFETNYGSFKVMLYDFTPKHRDLIVNAIQDSVYKKAFFNRVISNFVVQGGEHDVDIAKREAADKDGLKPRLAGEFPLKAFHKVGALGAGRDDKPEKASFLNQIYFVVGKKVSKEELTKFEADKGIKYSKKQRKTYLSIGGLPRLDQDYTVFGEIYEGLEVILKISQVNTDSSDYPLSPVSFGVTEIK